MHNSRHNSIVSAGQRGDEEFWIDVKAGLMVVSLNFSH